MNAAANSIIEITRGNYKATVRPVADGYGDSVFRVTVAYLDKGTATDAPSERVRFAKSYDTAKKATAAAARELLKCAA